MKIIVYGGTNNQHYSEKEMQQCRKLGKYLADIGSEVLTGACWGFPYFVGKAAVEAGGTVIGYTPAENKTEHIERYKFPMDGVSEMSYAKKSSSMTESFLKRSWDMTPFSDVMIALGGSWGTYFEIMLSFFYKKTIILVSEFGGAAEAFDNTHKFFDERPVNPEVHRGSTIIRVKTIDDAIASVEEIRSKYCYSASN